MFFILSPGRSGSRSMSNILSQHPELICTHEPVPRLIDETAAYQYGELPHDELVEILRESRPTAIDGRRYGESANRLSLAVPALADAYPDAQFIWVTRDGRDFVSSGIQRNWYTDAAKDTPWERNRLRGDRLGSVEPSEWESWSQTRKISWLWRTTNEIIERDTAALDADRVLHVRLEDLADELPSIASFLDVPNIRWVVPVMNARAAVPETGPGSANAVDRLLAADEWSQSQRDDFAAEAGELMDRWYPGWNDPDRPTNDATGTPGQHGLDPIAADVQVQLAELRTLRGELGVLTTHQLRVDRQMTELRAKNERLSGELLKAAEYRSAKQEVNNELQSKLTLEKQRTESWKRRAGEAERRLTTAERRLTTAEQRADELNRELATLKKRSTKLQRERDAWKTTAESLQGSASYRLGHRLVLAAKSPTKVAPALKRLAGDSDSPPATTSAPTSTKSKTPAAAPAKKAGTWTAPDEDLAFADLDRLDPTTITPGALMSFSMTAPTGEAGRTRLTNALATLAPGGVGRLTIPQGLDEVHADQIIDTVTAVCSARAIAADDAADIILEVTLPDSRQPLHASLLTLANQLSRRSSTMRRQIADLERRIKLEQDARERQLIDAQDSTQYRLGAAMVSVAHNPKNVVRLYNEVRHLQQRRRTPIEPIEPATGRPASLDLNAATILDEFTHDCFAPEFNLLPLERKAWKQQLDIADLVFVESAWRGNGATWKYTINKFADRGQDLGAVLARARERRIPTLFWNKEDPVSFDVFLDAAREFDHIFTTDADKIDDYRAAVGHDRVHALPFAAQPRLHNPIGRRRGADVPSRVCFAGSWRGDKYTQRGSDFDTLLTPALQRGALDIFDRYAGGPDEARLGFPEPYRSAVMGSLPYSEIGNAYRAYSAFLNVNSVQDSPTMFSRRVFELLACGTPVISTPARGIDEMLGDSVLVSDTPERTGELIDWVLNEPDERDRFAHRGYRLVHEQHSYERRVDAMLAQAEIPAPRPRRRVTVICVSNRPEMLDHTIDSFTRQSYADKEFVYVANSNEIDDSMLQRVESRVPGARALRLDESATLGECLNEALRLTDGDYFAKFDDDDHYGEHYLSDLMLTFPYSGAAVAGKQTYYAYMARTDETVLRFPGKEFRKAPRVVGGTIVADRSQVNGIEFEAVQRGTDTRFLEAVKARGLGIFSADRYNFCQVRHVDPTQHTWAIEEEEFLRACEPVGSGLCADEIFV